MTAGVDVLRTFSLKNNMCTKCGRDKTSAKLLLHSPAKRSWYVCKSLVNKMELSMCAKATLADLKVYSYAL